MRLHISSFFLRVFPSHMLFIHLPMQHNTPDPIRLISAAEESLRATRLLIANWHRQSMEQCVHLNGIRCMIIRLIPQRPRLHGSGCDGQAFAEPAECPAGRRVPARQTTSRDHRA